MPIRILLADDHTLFRSGLRRILDENSEFSIVAEAGSGLEAVDLARQHRPDVALVDIGMKELNGIEATTQILRQNPGTAVIILSMHCDEAFVTRSVKAGARGYILKDAVEGDMIRAIHMVHRGQVFFSPAVAAMIHTDSARELKSREVDDRYELLTGRERQVYHLLAEGKSNKEVANRLGMSVHTAETHRTHIMEKLELHGVAELVLSAVRRGLVL